MVERGEGYPILALHGGPGLDHHEFGDYLDLLTERYRLVLVDQRAQGRSGAAPESTWSLEKMAEDVLSLARAMGLGRYAVLGHSFGALVALQNAVDFPGQAAQAIVSSGVPSARYLAAHVERSLAALEPPELRERVSASWDRQSEVETPEEMAALLHDQMPFHFGDPQDPRIEENERYLEVVRDFLERHGA